MAEYENYILSAFFFILMCAIFYFWKRSKKKKSLNAQQRFILETLELAHSQFEIFNLKIKAEGAAKNGLSATLQAIDDAGLHMEASGYVAQAWEGGEVEVFFRARRDEGPVFYVFNSLIKKVSKSDYEDSLILIEMPQAMRVEKKRHFIRVHPQKNEVPVIGVWPLAPGNKLPKSASELGPHLTVYKRGMAQEPVQVENVSASGIALRIATDKNGDPPADFKVGSQLICLVVYAQDNASATQTAFWCTGEIMNVRTIDAPHPAVVLGLEFTNWAVLEKGTSEIHWAHSSPSRGARPILQWVEQIDKKQAQRA